MKHRFACLTCLLALLLLIQGESPGNVPGGINVTIAVSNVSCFNQSDGSVTATPSGGLPPYTFQWSTNTGSQSTSTATGLGPGTYSVTVSDAGSNSGTASASVSQPPLLIAAAAAIDVSCNGLNNGVATAFAQGGTPPYGFAWDVNAGSQTGQTATGLGPGLYAVAVVDANGCGTNAFATVGEPPLLSISAFSSNASCNGASDGAAVASATGGVPPYAYLWSNSVAIANNSSIPAGMYTVTVTDASGCSMTAFSTVNEPAPIVIAKGVTEVSCFGFCDGAIGTVPSGGLPPYTFAWSTGASTSSIVNLCPGLYVLTVTDDIGCSVVDSIFLVAPPQLTLGIAGNQVSCNGACDGAIQILPAGSMPPYAFAWSNGSTAGSLSNLCPGNYSVTVTDNDGCDASTTLTIVEPPALNLSLSSNPITCTPNCNGAITAITSGGVIPFTYAWSNGSTSSFLTNLCQGTYSVTVTDANGCTIALSETLTAPPPLTMVTGSMSESCNSACDGNAVVIASGGVVPYSYNWSTGDTTAPVVNLCPGMYFVTITDAIGCAIDTSFLISSPPILSVQDATVNACPGASDGMAIAIPTGGTPPYFFSWDNGTSNDTAFNLSPGTYAYTVTDFNGCVAGGSATVASHPALVLSTSFVVDASCFDACDGQISTTFTGGTPPYAYQWNTGAGGTFLSNLCAATYNLTVTDAQGCDLTINYFVDEPPSVQVTNLNTSPSCIGCCDGSIKLTVTSGTPVYTYLWDDPDAQTTSEALGLCAGTYSVTITESNACQSVHTFTLNDPCVPVVTNLQVDACDTYTVPSGDSTYFSSGTVYDTLATSAGCDSVLIIELSIINVISTVSESNQVLSVVEAADNYQWIDCNTGQLISGETGQEFTPSQNGSYAAISESNGCTDTSDCVAVGSVGLQDSPANSGISVFPNPTNGNFIIDPGTQTGILEIKLYNELGELISNLVTSKAGRYSGTIEGPSGMYILEVIPRSGEMHYVKIVKH